MSVGIVADDLTGANDSAVTFAGTGWATSLSLIDAPLDEREPGSVLALVSDARAQQGTAAMASTARYVARLGESGVERLFLKIDSTMRGSVAEQVAGGLDAWSALHPGAFGLICPAFPGMGRTVEGGRILVHGAGVETTPVGCDPVTPVPSSDMAVLLPGSTGVTIGTGGLEHLVTRIEEVRATGSRVIVVDAATTTDLEMIAAAVERFGSRCVPVGSAGLAGAMSAVWSGRQRRASAAVPTHAADRVVIVVSSVHDMSREQLARVRSSWAPTGIRVLEPSLDVALDPGSVTAWVGREIEADDALPEVVVIRSPDARPATTSDDAAREEAAVAIATSLAVITEAVFDRARADALVLVGGEGARAVLDRFGARSIRVTAAVREGIPIGLVEGGRADHITVVTKAGGFGTPDSLVEILPELLNIPDLAQGEN